MCCSRYHKVGLPSAAELAKLPEYPFEYLLHLPIGDLLDALLFTAHEPDGHLPHGMAAAHLQFERLACTLAQQSQLELAHRALEPEQQAVVERARVVHPVGIDEQRFGQRAQINQVMPIAVVARQPRGLQRKHRAGLSRTHTAPVFPEGSGFESGRHRQLTR